jgi:ketosteroid isomerase-like protein
VWSEAVEMAHAEAFVSSQAPSYVCVDHRSLGTWSSAGREETLQHWRGQAELAAGFTRRDDDILALTLDANLTRSTWYGTNRATGGPFENVTLLLSVFGDDGLNTRCEVFEPDCEAEALARFDEITGESARHPALPPVTANAATHCYERFEAAVAARDVEVLAERLDASLSVVHHPTGAAYGRRELVATWRSMLKADRLSFRNEVLASLGHSLALGRYLISIEGLSESHLKGFGLAEFDEITLFETAEHGRLVRLEIFAAEQLEKAAARLHERYAAHRRDDRRRSPSDSLLVPPNAAARAYDRWLACAEAGDWDALRALYAPNVVFDDRRRLFRMQGDIEMSIATTRHSIGAGAKLACTLLATAGDRLMLQRALWSSRDEAQEFEIETLVVYEVDSEERTVAIVVFDPDDRAAASAELFERWVASRAGDASSCGTEYVRAANAKDLGRVRAVLADDVVYEDRRRTGIGRLEGADVYIASLRAWWEIADEWHVELLRAVVVAPHGGVSVIRVWGKNAEGGEFETVTAGLTQEKQGRIVRLEVFEPTDLGAACARFEELAGQRDRSSLKNHS